MNQDLSHAEKDQHKQAAQAPEPASPEAVPGLQADLLRMQHTAGNRAAGQNLRPRRLPRVQVKAAVPQPCDPFEQDADRAADQVVRKLASPFSAGPVSVAQQSSTGLKLQRKPKNDAPMAGPAPAAAAPAEPALEGTAAPSLLVGDEAAAPGPGQMRKSEFLERLQAEVCSVAEAALAGTGRSTEGCPYLAYWFGYYSQKDSQHIERTIHKYAPETRQAKAAGEYIPLIAERVRQGVETWARTGEITGVPEELRGAASAGGPDMGSEGAAGAAPAPEGGQQPPASSGVQFKGREGGARGAGDPQTIRSQLGRGQTLDGGVRSRMEAAFGTSFSNVRLHTGAQAANLSGGLNARAFTVGEHIAFGPGEYQPGTLVGDAIIAHELAHVVQQGSSAARAAPVQKDTLGYNTLEEDADTSAAGVVASLWGGARGELTYIAQNAKPRLMSGLRLQRCGKSREFPEPAVGSTVDYDSISNPDGFVPEEKVDQCSRMIMN